MRIKIDYNFMMSEFVGPEHGISAAELESLAPKAREAHSRLMDMRAAGSLPFYDLPRQDTSGVKGLADELAKDFENFVLLGIGGSALGPIALHSALRHPFHNLLPRKGRGKRPRMFFMDNVDPDHFGALMRMLDPEATVFNVVTKSGGTPETMAQFMIVQEMVRKALGKRAVRRHLVMTTDPELGNLRRIADEEGYRSVEIPPGVGGRFSVFTPVGLLPAAVSGIDIDELLAGAAQMEKPATRPGLMENPAYLFCALQHLADTKKGKKIMVMMPYSQALRDIADWHRQMWAESIGKKFDVDGNIAHTGQTPVKALGATDQHSQVQLYMEGPNDKTFTFLRVEKFAEGLPIPKLYPDIEGIAYLGGKTMAELMNAEQSATETALMQAGRPCSTIVFPEVNPFTVGQALYMLQAATAFAGGLYNINPFDQPGVEEGKLLTCAMMGKKDCAPRKRELAKIKKKRDYII